MQYAALRDSLLKARESRQALLDDLFPTPFPATVMLSLNLPGPAKTGARAERLFEYGEKALLEALRVHSSVRGCDELGPFALYRSGLHATQLKRLAINLESTHPAGRLLDIDIFDHLGRQLGRDELHIPPRSCLLCGEPALACIHAKRHSSIELMRRAHAVIDAL